jgi:hypothetical protein
MATHPYELIPPAARKMYRPIIRIKLKYAQTGKATPQIRALLDSGADMCMAPLEIALWLGVTFDGTEQAVSIQTANGSISQAVKKTVTIATREGEYECPFFFVEGLNPTRTLLLGQLGFFDHFEICFDLPNRQFEIS